MAPFPRDLRTMWKRGAAWPLSRLPLLAATIILAAFFGLMPGASKDGQSPRGLQASDRGSDTPHLSKRDPVRALAAADRKDASGTHGTGDGGILAPARHETRLLMAAGMLAGNTATPSATPDYWPAPLPRAPPKSV
jgi:hypothetical protein